MCSLAVALVAVAPSGWTGEGGCPVGDDSPCVLVLEGPKAPRLSPRCTDEPWSTYLTLTQPERFSNADRDDYFETVMELDLDPANGCRCASFLVSYGAAVSGWTVDIGDSPTSNGYGGDQFTTVHAAEVEVVDGRLGVYTAVTGQAAGASGVERILELELPDLGGESFDFRVCDQLFRLEQKVEEGDGDPIELTLKMAQSQMLFALDGQESFIVLGAGERKDYRVFAAFNRVIHQRYGPPSDGRVGAGVRRVELRLTP